VIYSIPNKLFRTRSFLYIEIDPGIDRATSELRNALSRQESSCNDHASLSLSLLLATSNPESITRGPKELADKPRAKKSRGGRAGELFRQRRPSITRFLAENSLAPSLQNEGRRNRLVTRHKGAAFCALDLPKLVRPDSGSSTK